MAALQLKVQALEHSKAQLGMRLAAISCGATTQDHGSSIHANAGVTSVAERYDGFCSQCSGLSVSCVLLAFDCEQLAATAFT